MYGMIHRAVRQMLEDRAALPEPQAGDELRFDNPVLFISASTYDDAITLSLLQRAATALELDFESFLFEFGKYWIRFADASPYTSLMKIGGSTLGEFLRNLDGMHSALRNAMPEAITPHFQVIEENEQRIRLAYTSPRQGLNSFVRGLLCGLMERFSREGVVEHVADTEGGAEFLLSLTDHNP